MGSLNIMRNHSSMGTWPFSCVPLEVGLFFPMKLLKLLQLFVPTVFLLSFLNWEQLRRRKLARLVDKTIAYGKTAVAIPNPKHLGPNSLSKYYYPVTIASFVIKLNQTSFTSLIMHSDWF